MSGRKHNPKDIVEVPDADEMDNETFLKHLEHRHANECKVEGFISRNAVEAWIGPYRVFHDRLHRIAVPGQHDHEHELYDDDEEELE